MYRVHIEHDFAANRYKLYLLYETSGGYTVLTTHDSRRVVVNPENATNREDDYWALIDADAAPALLAALSKQLGAVEHPQQLRADYEHERARVDKLIDRLDNAARDMASVALKQVPSD